MIRKNITYLAIATALALGLNGCSETTPETIQEWKALGNDKKLIETLSNPYQFMRLEAISALTELKNQTAIEPLGELLYDPDPIIVHKAIEAMITIGGPSIEPHMLKAIELETEPARRMAAVTLGTIKSKKAVDLLIAALNDKYETVAEAAAISLGQIRDAKAIQPLTEKLHKNSYVMRYASAKSLSQIGGQSVIESLASVMGDMSENIRNIAIETLSSAGRSAMPYALKGLRDKDEIIRSSAVAILKKSEKIPTEGSDRVWYELAGIPITSKALIDTDMVETLAGIARANDALIEAAEHPEEIIREYAFQALSRIGKPAADAAVTAAGRNADKNARTWFAGRNKWKGAPSWRNDLWGALIALNPQFVFNPEIVAVLNNRTQADDIPLRFSRFKPSPEYAPLLIAQCATPKETDDAAWKKNAEANRSLAEKKLKSIGKSITLPLIAALDDADINIVASCAKILIQLDKTNNQPSIIKAFRKKMYDEVELAGSEFFKTVTLLEDPSIESLLIKIRPNNTRAIQVFEKKYPGIHVSIIPLPPAADQHPTAEPFKLNYLQDGRTKELRVIFRKNEDGEWAPEPPLPDQLP